MEIVIDGERPQSLKMQLAEYWEYRGLLRHLVIKELKVRYRHTTMGIAWSLAQPLLPAVILGLIFSRALTPAESHVPYTLFLIAGLAPWSFFAGAVTIASGAFVSNSYILTKVYFPRAILPAAAVLTATVEFAAVCLIVCVWAVCQGCPVSLNWIWLPFLFVANALFAFLIALGLSSLNVLYRDVRHALPFLMQVWMYATPVLYSPLLVSARWRWLFSLNPMSGIVLAFRHVLLGTPFDPRLALTSTCAAALAATIAVLVFLHLQDALAEKV